MVNGGAAVGVMLAQGGERGSGASASGVLVLFSWGVLSGSGPQPQARAAKLTAN